jgi:FkbM family methyltransferase
VRPNQSKLLTAASKAIAAPASKIVGSRFGRGVFESVDTYLNALLGKGAGSGWGLQSEVNAAVSVLKSEGLLNSASATIFDVGANDGEWSALMRAMAPSPKILMFEPQPACVAKIRERQIQNSEVIEAALSKTSGSFPLFTTVTDSAVASLHARSDSQLQGRTFDSISVQTVTFDEFVKTRSIRSVDFMKLDVEGHELDVLSGASESLGNGTLKALAFEFGSGNVNSRTFFRDFWELLDPLGFRISRITPAGGLLPIASYYEDLEYFRGATNYLAVSNRSK